MSRLDEDQEILNESEILLANKQPGEKMQCCLDEVLTVLRKYDVGVTLCLANDRESMLMYRLPEWCAVSLSQGGPEINPDKLWQSTDLEQLLSRTYRLATALHHMNEYLQVESSRLEDFVKDLGQHLLDPNRRTH